LLAPDLPGDYASCPWQDAGRFTPYFEAVYRKLGRRRVLGREVAPEADLAQLVQAGIPEQREQPLSIEESDHLVHLARVQALAEDVSATLKRPANSSGKDWGF
jgi:hypothetical protein